MRVCVLGEGAWGTAVSSVLADNGHEVMLWCYNKDTAQEIAHHHTNSRYLPGIHLSELIVPVTDFKMAFDAVDYIFEAIPVEFLRTVLQQAGSFISRTCRWVILSKGIERTTLLFSSEIIDQVTGYPTIKVAALGPSYAIDLAQRQLTGITLAASTFQDAQDIARLLSNAYFKPFLSLDMQGAQVTAAFKNMLAILIGALRGAGYADNLKAFILTRALAEMGYLAKLFGGKPETVYELCGVGDVILTTLGKHSKNQRVGYMLAQGQSLNDILNQTGFIPEGVNTALACEYFLKRHAQHLVIFSGIPDLIKGTSTITSFIQQFANSIN